MHFTKLDIGGIVSGGPAERANPNSTLSLSSSLLLLFSRHRPSFQFSVFLLRTNQPNSSPPLHRREEAPRLDHQEAPELSAAAGRRRGGEALGQPASPPLPTPPAADSSSGAEPLFSGASGRRGPPTLLQRLAASVFYLVPYIDVCEMGNTILKTFPQMQGLALRSE